MDKVKVECIDCDGTGLIEGQEWNGEKCRTCHGIGWVEGEDDEWEDAPRYDEHRPNAPGPLTQAELDDGCAAQERRDEWSERHRY